VGIFNIVLAEDEVNSDAREIEIRRWWTRSLDKGEWRRLLKEAKTLKEL
jgi:hypothetical protein